MDSNLNMKQLLDLGADIIRDFEPWNPTAKNYMDGYEKLRHMNLRSSERVYPITIGKERDTDTMQVDGKVILVCHRSPNKDQPLPSVWLNSGMLVSLDQTEYRDRPFDFSPRFKVSMAVDSGDVFSRVLRAGEVIWVTEEMFDKAFYPFVYSEESGHEWRVPLKDFKQAIELVK